MKRILLVEDNEDNQAIYATILNHAGHAVIAVGDGMEALRRAREDRPDLILMDISIPVLDGWEATRILKADDGTHAIPVVALTAHALAEDHARAQEIGFDGYLVKPIEPKSVLAEVERLLGLLTPVAQVLPP